MALTFTKTIDFVPGSMRVTGGTFTEGAAGTSGSIYTGLSKVEFMIAQPNASTSPTTQCTINTTLPATDPITIGYTAGVDGWWLAVGH